MLNLQPETAKPVPYPQVETHPEQAGGQVVEVKPMGRYAGDASQRWHQRVDKPDKATHRYSCCAITTQVAGSL